LIAAILLAAGLASCGQASEGDKEVPPKPQEPAAQSVIGALSYEHAGEMAPAAVFERRGGHAASLADFRGTPVLVNLWATWCAPCLAEMPALDRLAGSREGTLQVVAVSQDLEGWKAVTPFLDKAKLQNITVLLDQKNALSTALKAAGLPMSVLYDAEGREVWRVNGPREWDKPGGFVAAKADAKDPWAAAAARGVAFRAVGNEPGWYLELTPGKTVEVVADYGERKASLPAPESFEAAESKALSLKSGSHALAFAVEKKTCSDGMSDAVYPYAVKMTLDGRDYAGCGRAL
jgi:uncharacterized membrane protein/thiol-disulfide isomerase/thioredoxin